MRISLVGVVYRYIFHIGSYISSEEAKYRKTYLRGVNEPKISKNLERVTDKR